jgi:signal transduction histidine kinase
MVNEQLRNLSVYLQNARENERTMIAREIHDELGQSLTALKIDLSLLVKRLPANQKPVMEKAESMAELIETTIQSVKRISTDLRPGVLDHLGLTAAIEWQAEEFEKRTGIHCAVFFEPEEITLDKDRTTTVFRIFQETLTNVARHAKALDVSVVLKKLPDSLMLQVKDNGKGISEKHLSDPKSLGLIGIRERVYYWGGSLTISGPQNEGTTVTVQLPLDGRRSAF